jgi:antitoxin (DNA-binding transcriptional repressor) of toxin-antitoxin stability system
LQGVFGLYGTSVTSLFKSNDYTKLFPQNRTIYIDFILKIAYNKYKNKAKGGFFMVITATEFKTNFGKYLDMLSQEDIFITRNGKTIAKVINPQASAVNSIRGILKTAPADLDIKSIREERLEKYEDNV